MRLTSGGGPRAQYYDRNPTYQPQIFDAAAVAPHVLTTRFGYTVPSGREAMVESAQASADRATVAGTAGQFQVWVEAAPTGGNIAKLAQARRDGNVVDTSADVAVGCGVVLTAGGTVKGFSKDTSVTGTVDYLATSAIVEFDA